MPALYITGDRLCSTGKPRIANSRVRPSTRAFGVWGLLPTA
jgi:hypothetical protein